MPGDSVGLEVASKGFASPTSAGGQVDAAAVIGPPESIEPAAIYKLYRGTTGEVDGLGGSLGRVWADFPSVQLCWAGYDLPAREYDRASLFDLSRCDCETITRGDKQLYRVLLYSQAAPSPAPPPPPPAPSSPPLPPAESTPPDDAGTGARAPGEALSPSSGSLAAAAVAAFGGGGGPPTVRAPVLSSVSSGAGPTATHPAPLSAAAAEHAKAKALASPAGAADRGFPARPLLSVISESVALREFGEALQKLLASVQKEGRTGLEFIQKRLFQYLWQHQGSTKSEEEIYEAQAVLVFNLDPKAGIAYLREKLSKRTDTEVGEWLAQLSTEKGGLDPTMLGNYFSRKDTLEVFRAFVRCIDFVNTDIVAALRRLFDTFKPGGEGQVIERILDHFSEAYFSQWSRCRETTTPVTSYPDPDSICKAAFSLIMLNTQLHVATKKVTRKGALPMPMSVEDYIRHARSVLSAEEVPDEALRIWYEEVREVEISIDPLPKADFSKLPVQPDIEGWMIVVLSAQTQRRYWTVLALQRMYFFSDESEVEPGDAIDLKDADVVCVAQDAASKDRLSADLQPGKGLCLCFARNGSIEFPDAEGRAFEVLQQGNHKPKLLKQLSGKPRSRLALLAESPDLMEKWVNLISCGPY